VSVSSATDISHADFPTDIQELLSCIRPDPRGVLVVGKGPVSMWYMARKAELSKRILMGIVQNLAAYEFTHLGQRARNKAIEPTMHRAR